MPPPIPPTRPSIPPTPRQLFLVFSRIGLTSFGGGLSGWLLRAFVIDRPWMEEGAFLNGLAIAQALPGINVTNMAIWIGYRLAGTPGALASVAGIVLPPGLLIIVLASLFGVLLHWPLTHLAMDGAAAAAIGLSLSMGVLTARRVRRAGFPLLVMGFSFVTVGLLRWPLVWVLLGTGAVSVAVEYARLRRA